MDKKLQSIANVLIESKDIKYLSDAKIKVGAKTLTLKQFESYYKSIETEVMRSVDKDLVTLLLDTPDIASALFDLIIIELKDLASKSVSTIDNSSVFSRNYNYKNHNIIIDVVSAEKIIFNKTTRQATDLSYEEFREWLNFLPKNLKEQILIETIRGRIEYNPYIDNTISEADCNGQVVHVINNHIVPNWRMSKLSSPEYPEDFKTFLGHFVPDAESRSYVLDWLHYMLTGRNECHLLLHGKKGVGKGTLTQICKRLVGDTNFKLIDKGFWESRFNKELKNKRVCFFDEHDITNENVDYFKQYANPTISIEEKGKNVEKDFKNYASYIIANNNPFGNYLQIDDRRFSVPILSEEKLEHKFGEEWVEKFVERIENDDAFIANIGWALIQRKPTYSPVKPLKSVLFYRLVELAMSEWQRKLVELIESRRYNEIKANQLKDILQLKMEVSTNKIDTFLKNHTDKENCFYGSIKQKGASKDRYLVMSDKYRKEEVSLITDDEEDF